MRSNSNEVLLFYTILFLNDTIFVKSLCEKSLFLQEKETLSFTKNIIIIELNKILNTCSKDNIFYENSSVKGVNCKTLITMKILSKN